MEQIKELLTNLRNKAPLVHFITNYVTVNDCANITLACGGSPIMSDEEDEVEQICDHCSALVINIGTANKRTLASMLRAGKHANKMGIPVVLDPAGAGASDFRNNAIHLLLREVDFSVIKGNISEIKFLSDGIMSTQGVDACAADLVNENTIRETIQFSRRLSVMTGAIIVITGPIDIISDDERGYAIRNGNPKMSAVSGTGCMSAAVLGCFLGTTPSSPLAAAVASMAAMGLCGELAFEKMKLLNAGLSSYRSLLIDCMDMLSYEQLQEGIKIEQL